jgi:hypothetical protein
MVNPGKKCFAFSGVIVWAEKFRRRPRLGHMAPACLPGSLDEGNVDMRCMRSSISLLDCNPSCVYEFHKRYRCVIVRTNRANALCRLYYRSAS